MSDMLSPAEINVVNSSPSVLSWPITTNLTALNVSVLGIDPSFDKEDSWPEVTPPGWDGPITHTLWLFMNIGGWIGSGIIQYYRGLTNSGGAIWQDNQIAKNWVYDQRWGRMQRQQPATGDVIGFMLSAGNARGQDDHIAAERSNIVTLAMPAGPQSFTFSDNPIPVHVPPPNPTDPDQLTRIDTNVTEILRILQKYK